MDDRERPGGMLPEMPTLAEIERRLVRCDDELERLVTLHFEAAEQAANAEADWKGHRDRVLVDIANSGDKGAADLREARAKMTRTTTDPSNPETGDDLYRVHLVLEAREKSVDRQIRAIQTRMTGLMSLSKGVRGAGG